MVNFQSVIKFSMAHGRFFFCVYAVYTKFLVSGSADNTLRLCQVSTGKCLYSWEFPTAVKSVAFNVEGNQIVCITEQRMGFQCAIRVFDINTQDGTKRIACAFPIEMNF